MSIRKKLAVGPAISYTRRSRKLSLLEKTVRRLRFENLEGRAMLVAEGAPFNLSRSLDAAGLVGTVSADVDWGDGTKTSTVAVGGTTTGNIKIRFDYSLDTSGFFSAASRRAVLEAAAASVTNRLGDSLAPISPSGTNTWVAALFHPATGASINFNNLKIAANEIVVYAGAREFGATQLGSGGPGGIGASGDPAWLANVAGRGQAGALTASKTDIGPWGGSIAFDISTNWYFGTDPAGLQANQHDFYTVAAHELTHLIGFGTAPSWTRLVSGNTFTGPKARAANDAGGNVLLTSDRGHWVESQTDAGRKTLMGPTISIGIRDSLTPLDLAGLDDIGWDIIDTEASIATSHVYADNGAFPIQITYRGATVGLITDSLTATITNAIPQVTVVDDQSVTRDRPLVLTNIASILDPGFANPRVSPPTVETFRYSINWGDGTAADTGTATIDRAGSSTLPTLASLDGTHTYTQSGTFNVTVQVIDDDNGSSQSTFKVNVTDPPVISLELNRNSIAENAGNGAAVLTVRRSAPAASSPTTITITSSDASEAAAATSVIIPAGELSATVAVNAIDDNLLDGTQLVTLTGSGSGFQSGTAALSVTDFETLSATFTNASILENNTALFVLTVVRSNTDTSNAITVNIAGNVDAQLNFPATATIPAGSRQVQIPVEPINDDKPERSLQVPYRISATDYQPTEAGLLLVDDEKPLFQNPTEKFDVDNNSEVKTNDALKILNFIARRRPQSPSLDPETESPNGRFVDVNGDYSVTPSDALRILNEIARRIRAGQTRNAESLTTSNAIAAPLVDAVFAQKSDERSISQSLLF